MITVITQSFISFFAIYGFVHLIKEIINYIFDGSIKRNDDVVMVVKVCNAEQTLEATIRTLIWKCLRISNGNKIPDILIVDVGSDDSTKEIAEKLCRDYSFIFYTTYELYKKAKTK